MTSELKNVIDNVYTMTGINITLYEFDTDYSENSLYNELNIRDIEDELSDKYICLKIMDANIGIYTYAIKGDTFYLVCGPIAHHILTTQETHLFRRKCLIASNYLVNCKQDSVYAALSLLSTTVLNKTITSNELRLLFNKKESTHEPDYIVQQVEAIESFQLNHSIQKENEFLSYVAAGDISAISEHFASGSFLYPMPVENPLKNQEYMVVSAISLLSRTAINGGVPSTIALLQSDAFLKLLSKCTSEHEMLAIAKDAAIIFTKLVKQNQSLEEYSYISIRCKKLIHSNLFNPISLSSLAKELGVSKEYLSASFKKDYGITITKYINQKKSELACKILTSSDYSINRIAELLCFCSTSYFIKVFKENINVSPTEYRTSMS